MALAVLQGGTYRLLKLERGGRPTVVWMACTHGGKYVMDGPLVGSAPMRFGTVTELTAANTMKGTLLSLNGDR